MTMPGNASRASSRTRPDSAISCSSDQALTNCPPADTSVRPSGANARLLTPGPALRTCGRGPPSDHRLVASPCPVASQRPVASKSAPLKKSMSDRRRTSGSAPAGERRSKTRPTAAPSCTPDARSRLPSRSSVTVRVPGAWNIRSGLKPLPVVAHTRISSLPSLAATTLPSEEIATSPVSTAISATRVGESHRRRSLTSTCRPFR